jgi:hypothetical protein
MRSHYEEPITSKQMDALDQERSRIESQQMDRRENMPQEYNQPQESYQQPPQDYQQNVRSSI